MTATKRLGVLMDPIGAISYAKDSTLAMLLAAQARGFELAYLEQRDLLLRDGVALGRLRALTVRADPGGWFTLGEPALAPLASLDCVLMRKDPPFDTEYIYTTYILERAEAAGLLVVNRPQGLRDMNEKVYTAAFPQCCAPTLVTRDMAAMAAFLREQGKIVVKPLHTMGGRSIFVLRSATRTRAWYSRSSPTTVSASPSRNATFPTSCKPATHGCCWSMASRCRTRSRASPRAGTTAAISPRERAGSPGLSMSVTAGSRARSARRSRRGGCCSSASM